MMKATDSLSSAAATSDVICHGGQVSATSLLQTERLNTSLNTQDGDNNNVKIQYICEYVCVSGELKPKIDFRQCIEGVQQDHMGVNRDNARLVVGQRRAGVPDGVSSVYTVSAEGDVSQRNHNLFMSGFNESPVDDRMEYLHGDHTSLTQSLTEDISTMSPWQRMLASPPIQTNMVAASGNGESLADPEGLVESKHLHTCYQTLDVCVDREDTREDIRRNSIRLTIGTAAECPNGEAASYVDRYSCDGSSNHGDNFSSDGGAEVSDGDGPRVIFGLSSDSEAERVDSDIESASVGSAVSLGDSGVSVSLQNGSPETGRGEALGGIPRSRRVSFLTPRINSDVDSEEPDSMVKDTEAGPMCFGPRRGSARLALDQVKLLADRLNLSTRRPSYTAWKDRYFEDDVLKRLSDRLSLPDSNNTSSDESSSENFGRENDVDWSTERKAKINGSLTALKRDLCEMREQDSSLAKQLTSLRRDMYRLKLEQSSAQHQEILDEAIDVQEEREQLAQLCDLPPDPFSPTLKQFGVTPMNISARRFSVF